MAESRLQRWARKKAEASKEAEPGSHSVSAPPSTVGPEPTPEEQELAINEGLSEQGVLEKYDLPDPDAIQLGTDITGFMGKEIPELLRRRALRSLWKSNPVLAVLDGLNDYDEDFSNAATTVNGVQTLYRVGQGMFDKTAKAAEQISEQVEAPETIVPAGTAENATEISAGTAPETASETVVETEAEKSESESAVEPSINQQAQPSVTEARAEPAPRYRPRMRFDDQGAF